MLSKLTKFLVLASLFTGGAVANDLKIRKGFSRLSYDNLYGTDFAIGLDMFKGHN